MFFKDTALYSGNSAVRIGIDIAQGLALGMLLTGLIFSSRYGAKIRAFKQRVFKGIYFQWYFCDNYFTINNYEKSGLAT